MEGVFSNKPNKNDSPCSAGGDCSKFNALIHSVIDGEVTTEDLKFFEKHRDDCIHCLEHYGAEKEFVDEIRAKLARHTCPDALLTSIKDKINELK